MAPKKSDICFPLTQHWKTCGVIVKLTWKRKVTPTNGWKLHNFGDSKCYVAVPSKKLTNRDWLEKLPMFNRKYLFTQGPFSSQPCWLIPKCTKNCGEQICCIQDSVRSDLQTPPKRFQPRTCWIKWLVNGGFCGTSTSGRLLEEQRSTAVSSCHPGFFKALKMGVSTHRFFSFRPVPAADLTVDCLRSRLLNLRFFWCSNFANPGVGLLVRSRKPSNSQKKTSFCL